MATHWTYRPIAGTNTNLEQGDILEPSQELVNYLNEGQPQQSGAGFLGYVVLTQTCDLVRRNEGACKAKLIGLAGIEPLSLVLSEVRDSLCKKHTEGVFYEETKSVLVQLLERLLNQNEQAEGLFYFHPDGDSRLGVGSVARLRASFAVPSAAYEILLRSRVVGLDPAFKNKLGWLVGNLYSRVDTPDWGDQDGDKEFRALINAVVKQVDWVSSRHVELLRDAGASVEALTPKEIQQRVKEIERDKVERVGRIAVEYVYNRIFPSGFEAELQRIDQSVRERLRTDFLAEIESQQDLAQHEDGRNQIADRLASIAVSALSQRLRSISEGQDKTLRTLQADLNYSVALKNLSR